METRSQAAAKRAADRDGDGCPPVDQSEKRQQQQRHHDDEKHGPREWCIHLVCSLAAVLVCTSVAQIVVSLFVSNAPITPQDVAWSAIPMLGVCPYNDTFSDIANVHVCHSGHLTVAVNVRALFRPRGTVGPPCFPWLSSSPSLQQARVGILACHYALQHLDAQFGGDYTKCGVGCRPEIRVDPLQQDLELPSGYRVRGLEVHAQLMYKKGAPRRPLAQVWTEMRDDFTARTRMDVGDSFNAILDALPGLSGGA